MSWSADLLDLLIASRTLGGGTLEGRPRAAGKGDRKGQQRALGPDRREPRGTTQPQVPGASTSRARAEKEHR
jgi:hypothetical protein